MKKLSFYLLVINLFLASCGMIDRNRVRGNGDLTLQEKTVSTFTDVSVHGAIDVYITEGPLAPVKIEADENLQEYIEIRQEDGRLIIGPRKGFSLDATEDIKVYLTAPRYRSVRVSGACDIIGENKISSSDKLDLEVSGAGEIKMEVDVPEISAEISGAGKIVLVGQARDFHLELTGAGGARCYDLKAENVTVEISGAGNADVYASSKLNPSISGAGTVRYKGGAQVENSRISGAGSIKKVD